MAFREREVTGVLIDGDGSPLKDAYIKFKLTAPLGYTATHIVVDREFTAQTNGDGEFTITLWCDEDSLVAINYNVTFPNTDDGQPDQQHIASFSLAYGDGAPITLAALINASVTAPSPDELLYTLILQLIAENAGGGGDLPQNGMVIADENGQATTDVANIYWDFINKILNLRGHSTEDYGATAALNIKTTGPHTGAIILDTTAYNLYMWFLNNGVSAGYIRSGDGARILTVGGVNAVQFGLDNYGAPILFHGLSDASKFAEFKNPAATKRPILIVLAAGQTANAFEIRDNAENLLSDFDKLGAWQPPSLADSSASANSIYYSTNAGKLVYKDKFGSVTNLY